MGFINIYFNKGTSHGRNKFGRVITPIDATKFALFCIERNIDMPNLSSEEFDKAYLEYMKEDENDTTNSCD